MSKDRKKLLVIFIAICLLLSSGSLYAFSTNNGSDSGYSASIDENIPLEESGPHQVLVKVNWDPDLEPIKFNHDAVIAELKAEAARTQAPVLAYLEQKADAKVLNTFWLTNLILVEANPETIREMATFTSVQSILANFNVTVPAIEAGGDPGGSAEVTWNIEKVRAPDVWEMLGITGEGIKFATTDTGLEIDHPDLIDTLFTADPTDPKYPGGWIEFDSAGNPVWSTPHDTYGHGTATYGLIVGDAAGPYGAVGMAPGAKGFGMHALTLPGGSGSFAQVIAGLEWVIDPYDEAGNHYPPAQVSSHSWGAYGYYSELIEPIRNMWYAGHFVAASIGNAGEGTSGSPGNIYETVGVGATDINDYVVGWSSGEWVYRTDFPTYPPDWPEKWIKPELSAPGVNVIVPYWGKTWRTWSGTSFSAPHVAGAAVLMLSGNPTLTPPEIQAALEETAVWYNYYYDERPDTRYGWGRIDAFEATMMVALPQGVRGIVTDAITGLPIPKVEVYAHEANRSVYTDENGYYDMRLLPGNYTLTFSRFGYESTTITDVSVVADEFTWLDVTLTPVTPGYVAGHVYFEPTQIGIPGALVEALEVPVPIRAETDADGYYTLTIPPGTYDFKASAYGFSSATAEDVEVIEGETTVVDFNLTQLPKLAVVGDYPSSPGKLTDYLTKQGYLVDAYRTIASVIPNIPQYQAIIVNTPRYYGMPSYSDMQNFISATDANGVGVVWLDSWWSQTGGYLLWYYSYYYGLPIGFSFRRYATYRYGSYPSVYNYYKVVREDSDILDAWPVGTMIPIDKGVWHDSAYYYMYTAENDTLRYLANLGFYYYGYYYNYYTSLVKFTRDNNKWTLLSAHATTPWVDIGNLHEDAKAILLNSINWASKAVVPHAKFVVWDLKAEPDVTLWKYPVNVSVGIKNVGWITGTDTVEMYVDTILEGSTDVTLAPGEYSYLSWNVSRFYVGTYTVRVRHLTTTFRVRPPQVTLQAFEFSTSQPLVGADVYGYYRKYAGPGYFEQWSYTYGGYGHSQHAQPVGDIDEDGVNEIIIGGYEWAPDWGRARILSYDAATETYIEEYSWYVPGGFYHSPSGSAVLDLDEDGDLEFAMSWTYSGADGVYAYDWDGENLTELDYYPAAFVFDVYAGDYDDDGDIEVLVANAPWGGTYYHVIALGWQNGQFVVEATWNLGGTAFWWEAPMLWSGDTDNDGKTEVIVSISNSYSATAGTWALNWNPSTGQWEEELVYADLIGGGTHYGVVVGDVDGDGTPEIGIGNNVPGYVGAAAVLIEWDGTAYTKVWEGSWPGEYSIIEALAIGDADNDGQNEFLAGGGNVHIISWTGTNYAEEATITETSGLLSGTVIGDMDTDGLNEIKAQDIIGLGPGKEWIFKYSAEPTPLPGWYFEYFGTTDENGMLVFDSPESVIDVYLFVYRAEETEKGWRYLLEKDMTINDDVSVTYKPTFKTEAVIVSRVDSYNIQTLPHMGVTWLQKDGLPILWPFTSEAGGSPANIVVTPETYVLRHMLNVIDPYGSWWYYFMAPDRIATLSAGQTYGYKFAGPIQGFIQSAQDGTTIKIDWTATDNYGHQITGITQEEVDWLSAGSSEYIPVPIEPAMLEDIEIQVAETVEYYPLIILYSKTKKMIESGYVQWLEKPAYATVEQPKVSTQLSFMSGPYGNPNAKMYVTVIKETG